MTKPTMQSFIVVGKQAAGGIWGRVGKGLLTAGKTVGKNTVPAALGAGAGYGTWHAAVPEDASLTQKIEGGLAAGLAGFGAAGLGRANSWRNAMTKAKQLVQKDVASGMRPDFSKHMQNAMLSDILMPKIKYLGAATVPVGMSNVQSMLSNAGAATKNVADVTDTWKELADQAGAKDPSGKSIVEKIRDAVNKVTDDASTISGTLTQGTQDVTGSLSEATRDIGKNLSDASGSFAGATKGVKDLTDTIKPVAEEFTRKDEQGNTLFGNMSRLFSGASDSLGDFRDVAKKNLNKFDRLGDVAQYAPYLAAGGLTAGGLYGLYRMLRKQRAVKKNRNDDE